jgi:hypothetical protein
MKKNHLLRDTGIEFLNIFRRTRASKSLTINVTNANFYFKYSRHVYMLHKYTTDSSFLLYEV